MITGDLEYLMSSLPDLSFQDRAESRLQVLSLMRKYAGSEKDDQDVVHILDEEAVKFLSTQDHHLIQSMEYNRIHAEAFQRCRVQTLAEFAVYMHGLKQAVREIRLARKNDTSGPSSKRSVLPLTPGNPLEEELQLLKWQWDKLDELSIGHYTDLDALALYKLKLMLLLRWWSFDPDKGYHQFLNITKGGEDGG